MTSLGFISIFYALTMKQAEMPKQQLAKWQESSPKVMGAGILYHSGQIPSSFGLSFPMYRMGSRGWASPVQL
jgi:hypothetical protein